MSERKVGDKLTEIIDSFIDKGAENTLRHQRAIERFDDLVKRGLVKERESMLVPIEEMHKQSPLLTRGAPYSLVGGANGWRHA
jgi:hypothetical protein